MKIALLQMCSGRTVSHNVEAVLEGIGQAAAQGAAYVQTPEMTTLVERDRNALNEAIRGDAAHDALSAFQEAAQHYGITLHIGSMAVPLEEGRVANRAHVIGADGELVATYDKVHMFDVDLDSGESWRESAVYAPGDHGVLVDLKRFVLGLSICYDLRFPYLYRAYAQSGAHVLSVPAAFTATTGQAHWHVLLRARAIETGCFVMAAAQGGSHEDGRETYGHSLVIDPWGRVVAEKADNEPGVLMAEIDLTLIDQARGQVPSLRHTRDAVIERRPQ